MTTYGYVNQDCALCGTSVQCSVLNSTNAMGSADLDLRPPEMQRSTMHTWLQECPNCRYVNGDLSETLPDARQIVDSDEFQAILQTPDLPGLASRFARFAVLRSDDAEVAGISYLRAAWDCDDSNSVDRAIDLRNKAADILRTLAPFDDTENQATQGAVLVDILRRAGRFDESKALATTLAEYESVAGNDILRAVLEFQLSLCSQGDTDCHTVKECAP